MNPYQRKIFGFVPHWAAIVALGCFIMTATAALSFFSKDDLRQRVRTVNAPYPTTRFLTETERLEQNIRVLEDQIKSEKRLAELEDLPVLSAEEKERRRKLRAEKLEKWETKIAELKTKIEELNRQPPPKSGSWYEENNIELLFTAVLVGVFGLCAALMAVFMRVKANPGKLRTDLDERALYFLAASVFGAGCIFLLSLWYLSVW